MKIIHNIYEHVDGGFSVSVESCNKKIVRARDSNGSPKTFNRSKFEWMINKGIFTLTGNLDDEPPPQSIS